MISRSLAFFQQRLQTHQIVLEQSFRSSAEDRCNGVSESTGRRNIRYPQIHLRASIRIRTERGGSRMLYSRSRKAVPREQAVLYVAGHLRFPLQPNSARTAYT